MEKKLRLLEEKKQRRMVRFCNVFFSRTHLEHVLSSNWMNIISWAD